ncbi:MAG TPA: HEPN domain-containing protein [Candidatus Latescibacteria bacterium]|nr:HEPN domain-containing protein [Candidatus Latescibacterota bacterium]
MERGEDWMDQARWDLKHARADMEREFYDWACFSAQQASEKAVLQRMGIEAWGHSVADLLEALSQRYTVPRELVDSALELDKVYIPARYPDALPSGSPRRSYTLREAERLIGYADKIVRFCEALLSS